MKIKLMKEEIFLGVLVIAVAAFLLIAVPLMIYNRGKEAEACRAHGGAPLIGDSGVLCLNKSFVIDIKE